MSKKSKTSPMTPELWLTPVYPDDLSPSLYPGAQRLPVWCMNMLAATELLDWTPHYDKVAGVLRYTSQREATPNEVYLTPRELARYVEEDTEWDLEGLQWAHTEPLFVAQVEWAVEQKVGAEGTRLYLESLLGLLVDYDRVLRGKVPLYAPAPEGLSTTHLRLLRGAPGHLVTIAAISSLLSTRKTNLVSGYLFPPQLAEAFKANPRPSTDPADLSPATRTLLRNLEQLLDPSHT